MKVKVYGIDGKPGKEMVLPSYFSHQIRADLIQKVIESKKKVQPYAPGILSGNSHSASGALKHRRRGVWKSQYGRGMSRIPRKQMSRRGSQFYWVGATVPNTRGGRRAHPPKVLSMLGAKKINKRELRLALISALSATASLEWLNKRYSSLVAKVSLPFVVESKFTQLKVKDLKKAITSILGEELAKVAFKSKRLRAGKGKLRGRKYKSNQGVLLVVGKEEKLRTKSFDIQTADKLGVCDLAKGCPGRLTIYTEKAIQELEERLK